MSRSTGIFIDHPGDLASVAKLVGSIVGSSFREVSRGDEPLLEAASQEGCFTLGTHEFENDRDMDFEAFPYHLELEASGIADGDARDAKQLELGRRMYEALRRTDRFDLMLVDDLQHKLAEHRIGGKRAGSSS